MKRLIFLLILFFSVSVYAQKFEGLAPTPPMGWNTWNTFGTKINEKLIKETAEAMIASGMRDAGYEYIVLDDAWMTKRRDPNGNLVADPVDYHFSGIIDEVAIYGSALNAQTVSTLYQTGISEVPEPSTIAILATGCFVFWRKSKHISL